MSLGAYQGGPGVAEAIRRNNYMSEYLRECPLERLHRTFLIP